MTFSKLTWQKGLRGVKMSHARYRVLMAVATYTDGHGMSAHPGTAKLSEDTGIDQRDVQRHLRALESDGWLVVLVQGGNQLFKGAATVYGLGNGPAKGQCEGQCLGQCKGHLDSVCSKRSPNVTRNDAGTNAGNDAGAFPEHDSPPDRPRLAPDVASDSHPSRTIRERNQAHSGPTVDPQLTHRAHPESDKGGDFPTKGGDSPRSRAGVVPTPSDHSSDHFIIPQENLRDQSADRSREKTLAALKPPEGWGVLTDDDDRMYEWLEDSGLDLSNPNIEQAANGMYMDGQHPRAIYNAVSKWTA